MTNDGGFFKAMGKRVQRSRHSYISIDSSLLLIGISLHTLLYSSRTQTHLLINLMRGRSELLSQPIDPFVICLYRCCRCACCIFWLTHMTFSFVMNFSLVMLISYPSYFNMLSSGSLALFPCEMPLWHGGWSGTSGFPRLIPIDGNA